MELIVVWLAGVHLYFYTLLKVIAESFLVNKFVPKIIVGIALVSINSSRQQDILGRNE